MPSGVICTQSRRHRRTRTEAKLERNCRELYLRWIGSVLPQNQKGRRLLNAAQNLINHPSRRSQVDRSHIEEVIRYVEAAPDYKDRECLQTVSRHLQSFLE